MRQWVCASAPRASIGGVHADAAAAFTDGGRSGSRGRGRDNGDRVGADPRTTGVCECTAIGRRGHCSTRQAHHAMRNMNDARCNVNRNVRQLLQSGRDATGSAQPEVRSMPQSACASTRHRQHATDGMQRAKRAPCNRDAKKQTTRTLQHATQARCNVQRARCNADQMQHAALQHATRRTRHATLKQVTSTLCEYRCEYP
jgi:hypothetical protein